jgi:hypothetical protein
VSEGEPKVGDPQLSAEHLSGPVALWHADRVPGEELGRWSQQSIEDTLARQRRLLGHDHPDTLRVARNLAAGLSALGKLYGAKTMRMA